MTNYQIATTAFIGSAAGLLALSVGLLAVLWIVRQDERRGTGCRGEGCPRSGQGQGCNRRAGEGSQARIFYPEE